MRYLIVGGYAVTFHARPRFTKYLDVWVDPSPANSERVFAALSDFGAPLQAHGVTARDFSVAGTIYQIGVPPTRIDILTEVEGLQFDTCWERRAEAGFADVDVAYLAREDLIANKRAVGGPQDLDDVRELERR